MRKLLTTKLFGDQVPMPVQCNIISLIGNPPGYHHILFIRWRQIKILKTWSIWRF